MRRIGILTHYYNSKNIGGLLQAYALTKVLSQHDFFAEQISFVFQTYDVKAYPIRKKLYPKVFKWKDVFLYPVRLLKCLLIKWYLHPYLMVQNGVINGFANAIPHSIRVYNNLNINYCNDSYDVICIGSDQVWNLDLLPHFAYYGEFAKPEKKVIAYAASSNTKQFSPIAEQIFIDKLQRINAISVREKTLKKYIEHITNRNVTVVLDPTFLISHQEWLKIAHPVSVPQKPYIFCYFLGSKAAWQREMAQIYADKYGYEIIHLPYITQYVRKSDKYLKGITHYDVGPREFISLINGAECVFTDSFHGLAFSINFGKNFYVFNRDDENGVNSMNARITDTLEMFSLTKRHIKNKDVIFNNRPIDFTNAHKILEQEKQKSIDWLLNALKE